MTASRAHTAALSLQEASLVHSRPHTCRTRYSRGLRSTCIDTNVGALPRSRGHPRPLSKNILRRGMFFFPLNQYVTSGALINADRTHFANASCAIRRLRKNIRVLLFFLPWILSRRCYDNNEIVLALRHSKACPAPEIRPVPISLSLSLSFTCLTSYVNIVYATY